MASQDNNGSTTNGQERPLNHKITPVNHVSVQQVQKENERLKQFLEEKDRAIESKQKKLNQLSKQLQEKQLQLQAKEQQLSEKKAAIAALESQVQCLREEAAEKDRTIEQLQGSGLRPQKTSLDHIDEEEDREEKGGEEGGGVLKKDVNVVNQVVETTMKSVELIWEKRGNAPCDMRRGTSVVHGSTAYFAPLHSVSSCETNVFAYNSDQEKWLNQPMCPQQHFTLAVVNDHVTAVGGEHSFQPVNTLLSLIEDPENGKKWIEKFPPMPTKRYSTAVACSSRSLVVAGGQAGPRPYDRLSTVELMDTESLQWFAVRNLPKPYTQASAAICSDVLYLVGGVEENGKTKEVWSCSIEGLRKSARMQGRRSSIGARFRSFSRSEARPIPEDGIRWKTIENLPFYLSTCTTCAGRLIAVGGYSDLSNGPTSAVRIFNAEKKAWDVGADLPTSRYLSIVAVLPGDKIMAVGGAVGVISDCDIVEIASLH